MRYTREQACLAWLAQGMLGSRRLKKLLDEYGSAEAAYDAFQRDHGASLQNRISDYSLSLLRASASREKLHDMLVTMRKWNMGLVSMADDMYPESLRNIPEPPYMLFYQGDLRAAEGRCITVIGSRSATVAGIAATKSLCRDLSKQGVCIVSGLAVGIDAAAHEGCLDGGSPTIGVAASGLNVPYPSENVALKARILSQGGLLLSEYPPDMQSSKYVFAVRNRILAGLGHAVVLMEARIRSGSMLTVHHARIRARMCSLIRAFRTRRCPKGRINSCGKAQSTSQVRRIFWRTWTGSPPQASRSGRIRVSRAPHPEKRKRSPLRPKHRKLRL